MDLVAILLAATLIHRYKNITARNIQLSFYQITSTLDFSSTLSLKRLKREGIYTECRTDYLLAVYLYI